MDLNKIRSVFTDHNLDRVKLELEIGKYREYLYIKRTYKLYIIYINISFSLL